MKTPPNMIRTYVSPMLLRQIKGYKQFTELRRLSTVHCFFDKIDLHTNSIEKEYLTKCTFISEEENTWGYQLKKDFVSPSGIRFILLSSCNFESNWQHKVILCTTRVTYLRFSDLRDFLNDLLGEVTVNNHQLSRLDIGFGLDENEVSMELLYYCSHLKWKQSESQYRGFRTDFKKGRITGLHSNGGSVRTSMYIECAKPKGQQRNAPQEVKTEFQVKKGPLVKKDINSIFDLIKISETNLLNRINFYDPIWVVKNKKGNLRNVKQFQQDVHAMGFNQARKKNNKNRNFDRDIGKFLSPLQFNNGKATLAFILKKRWIRWLENWYNS